MKLKRYRKRVRNTKVAKSILNLILIGFIVVSGYGIINIININYGDFAKEVWKTQQLVTFCHDMEDFSRDYPKSTFNKQSIKECKVLGINLN